MFCVVKRRSNFVMKQQTTDTDESYWGLFAVSDKWWCDKEKDGGICNVKCSDLLTDIEKNAKCGRRVYRQVIVDNSMKLKKLSENFSF